jgi:hypothetical protein
MKAINFYLYDVDEVSAIPNLLKFLAIPRLDGQQQVVSILRHPTARQHRPGNLFKGYF